MDKRSAGRRRAAWCGFGAVAALAAAQARAGELHLLNYGAPPVLGIQGNRHAEVGRFGVSEDGRRVAFETASNNLAAGDSNEFTDIYVTDAQTGALTRVSRRPDGGEPTGRSFDAAISGDGSRVAYQSDATDIVPGAQSGRGVFLVEVANSQTRRLTPAQLPPANGTPAQISGIALSQQGTRAVFITNSPLVPEDQDELDDLYGWTDGSGALQLLSVDANGQPLAGVVDDASAALTPDGRYASFSMRTITGVASEGGVFVRDLEQPLLDCVWGPPLVASMSVTALSADARHVVFSTYEAIVPGDANGRSDVYVFDRVTRTVEAVSVAAGGATGNDDSVHAVISGDGRYVVFGSAATDFEPGVSGPHLYRRDRVAGTTTRLTPSAAGAASWMPQPALSRDGHRVVFDSPSDDLVDGDDNRRGDVFAIDAARSVERISQARGTLQFAGATTGRHFSVGMGRAFPLGDDGSVAFASEADNLGPQRRAGVFRADIAGVAPAEVPLDLQAPSSWPVSLMLAGASTDGSALLVRREPFDLTGGWGPGQLPSEPWDLWRVDAAGQTRIDTPAAVGIGARTTQAMLSDDGRFTQFVSYVRPPYVTPPHSRLFLHDAQTGLLTRVDANDQGVPADTSIQPRSGLSRNGRYSAFVTGANNLVANDTDGSVDLFLRDNQTAQLTRLRHPQTGAPLIVQARSNTEAITVSDDGLRVAYVDTGGVNGEKQRLQLLDRTAQTLVNVCGNGAPGFVRCVEPTLSADGAVLAFAATQALLPHDIDELTDVYSYRPALDWLQLESVDAAGASGRGIRMSPQLSASGESLTFLAIGGGWRTAPQITGDSDWLYKRVAGDAIFYDGYEMP
ncbi:MAG TPA: hypothetical protein VLF18_13640 [Tahibacter sp.]|uniref:TolB family protein n=1 Tax=Tahibacter sp. TaxID=2056211 RepID=UPI002CA6710F|nr:hypothetical protein [Tahibacter sp.]HSX61237.1 hypothetical protein [Tahibacter sp.]